MGAASRPRPKDPDPLADQPRDDCSKGECSDDKKIPHPLGVQVTAQSLPPTTSLGTSVSTSTARVSAKHPHPEPLLKAQTHKCIGCTKKEELLASSHEEEPPSAHGITGKISKVFSHFFSSSKPPCLDP